MELIKYENLIAVYYRVGNDKNGNRQYHVAIFEDEINTTYRLNRKLNKDNTTTFKTINIKEFLTDLLKGLHKANKVVDN